MLYFGGSVEIFLFLNKCQDIAKYYKEILNKNLYIICNHNKIITTSKSWIGLQPNLFILLKIYFFQ